MVEDWKKVLALVREYRLHVEALSGLFASLREMATTGPSSLLPFSYDEAGFAEAVAHGDQAHAQLMSFESNTDLLSRIEMLCELLPEPTTSKALDSFYERLAGIGLNSEDLAVLQPLREAIAGIRMAEVAQEQLAKLNAPPQVQEGLMQAIAASKRMEAYADAIKTLDEHGHLGVRLREFAKHMAKAGVGLTPEHEKAMRIIETIYAVLAEVEFLRDISEGLGQAIDAGTLRALRKEALRVRELNSKLTTVGKPDEIETQLLDFLAAANLPTKSQR